MVGIDKISSSGMVFPLGTIDWGWVEKSTPFFQH
jgi:hypothetical protein